MAVLEVAIAAAVFLAACSPPRPPACWQKADAAPMTVQGGLTEAYSPERSRHVADVAARQFGIASTNGLALTWVSGLIPACGTAGEYTGCNHCGEIAVMQLPASCAEGSALVHEVLHSALGSRHDDGDANHSEPEWCDDAAWAAIRDELLAGMPYGDCYWNAVSALGYQRTSTYCPK